MKKLCITDDFIPLPQTRLIPIEDVPKWIEAAFPDFHKDTWDLTSYATSLKAQNIMYFKNMFAGVPSENTLILQLKIILCVIISVASGNNGVRISNGSLFGYLTLLKNFGAHCVKQKIDIYACLSNPSHLSYFSSSAPDYIVKRLKALLSHLRFIAIDGLSPSTHLLSAKNKGLPKTTNTYKQHPAIPSNIFMNIIATCHIEVNYFNKHSKQIVAFSDALARDKNFGRSITQQFYNMKTDNTYEKSFLEAAEQYKMERFIEKYSIENVSQLSKYFSFIQWCCKTIAHIYSGMRRSEGYALRLNCLGHTHTSSGKRVRIFTTTTKLHGKKVQTSFVTSPDVVPAIKAAVTIFHAIAGHSKIVTPDECYIFISTSHFPYSNGYNRFEAWKKTSFTLANLEIADYGDWLKLPIIQKDDIAELQFISPFRDWESEEKFQIGKPWPLTTHQLRRSLTVYATQSGLVSNETMRVQLGHFMRSMMLYYAKGSSFAKSLIGENTDHIAYELTRENQELNALAYIKHVISSNEQLFGGHGTFIEKNIKPLNLINVVEFRESTIQSFKRGLIAFKETIVGACMSLVPCNHLAHADISHCIKCSKSSVQLSKLEKATAHQTIFLNSLEVGSVEYRTQLEMNNNLLAQIKKSRRKK